MSPDHIIPNIFLNDVVSIHDVDDESRPPGIGDSPSSFRMSICGTFFVTVPLQSNGPTPAWWEGF